MKTKLTLILMAIGIAVSLGMSKIKNQNEADKKSELVKTNNTKAKNVGGFISEDR